MAATGLKWQGSLENQTPAFARCAISSSVVSTRARSPVIGELRAFCAALALGSMGRAARLLGISQPALSKRLRMLEALAGTRLLDRSPLGVTPTPAGARLDAEARRLLSEMENVEALMTGLAGAEAPVRLAASPTIAEFVLPGPLVDFERLREHHLCVELFIANSATVWELVAEGRCELGLAAADSGEESEELQELPLLDDEVIVAVPEKHAWAASEEIEVEDLVQMPMVMRDPGASSRRVVESALAERDLSLASPLAEVGSTHAAKETAHSERAPVLLSRLAVRDSAEGLVVRRVRGLSFHRRFVVVIASEETLAPAARALAHHLCDALQPRFAS